MHANSSSVFRKKDLYNNEGASSISCEVADNGFHSPLWPDGVSVTEHLNIAREGAHFSHEGSGSFLMKGGVGDDHSSIYHDNVANVQDDFKLTRCAKRCIRRS